MSKTYITNGSQFGQVLGTDAKGTKIANIAMNSRFGGNAGMTQVIEARHTAEHGTWRPAVIGEWFPVIGAPELHQRYVWSTDYMFIVRELRRTAPAA